MNNSDKLYNFFLPLFESVKSVSQTNKTSFLTTLQNSSKNSRDKALELIGDSKADWSLYGKVVHTLNQREIK